MGKEQVIGGAYVALMIALAVAMGMAADSLWVGLLVFAGILGVHIGVSRALDTGGESAIWIAWFGVACIWWAAQLAEYSGRWLWSIPLGLSAVLLIVAGAATIGRTNFASLGFFVLGGTSAVMAVLGPLQLYGLNREETQEAMGGLWWVSILLLGLIALGAAVYQAKDFEPGFSVALTVIGVGLLAIGSWFGRDASVWWLVPVWVAATVLVGYGAWEIRDRMPGAAWAMLLIATACFGFAIAAPVVLPGAENVGGDVTPAIAPITTVAATTAPPQTTAPPSTTAPEAVGVAAQPDTAEDGWFSSVWSAVWHTVRSGWGILYLTVAFVLGSIWSRRWGGIVAVLALLGAIAWTAGLADTGYGRASELLSMSPASLSSLFLVNSGRWFGSPGWGVLLLGAGFALAVLPSVRRAVTVRLESGTATGVSGMFATGSGIRGKVPEVEGWAAATVIAHMVILGGVVVSVWVGLQRIPTVAGTASFLGIPDITVASFKPVWHLSYFLVGLAIGVATVVNQRMYRRAGLRQDEKTGEVFGALLGSILLALVVPAGVLLLLLSHNVVVGVTTVLVGSRVAREVAEQRKPRPPRSVSDQDAAVALLKMLQGGAPQWPTPEPMRREPEPEIKPKPEPLIEPLTPLSDRTVYAGDSIGGTQFDPGATVFAGDRDFLYQSPRPLVDVLPVGHDVHVLLYEDGRLARWHHDRIEDISGFVLEKPLGLALGRDSDVIAADGAKRLLSFSVSNGDRPQISERRVDLTVGCFAVNPFGTIVAYAPVRRPGVFAVLLASGDQQVLAEDVGSVTAMAFSTNGRNLALGLRDGRVRLLSMSTRCLESELAPPSGESSKVVTLAECPDHGWVAAFQSGGLVQWNEDGTVVASLKEGHRLSSLAVCGESGRVAVGSTDGHVLVRPADLDHLELDEHSFTDEVVRVAFEPGQRSLVSAGRDGTVRRTTL